MSNNIEDLKKLALEQGWTIVKQGGTRLRWQNSKGDSVITGAELTNKSSFYNARSNLIRNGLELPGRKPHQTQEEPVAKQPSPNRTYIGREGPGPVNSGMRHQINPEPFPEGLPPGLAMAVAIEEKVAGAADRLINAGKESVELALLAIAALEDKVNVVADAVAARSQAWDGTIPQLRADVRALKERPVAVPCDHAVLLDKVGREILAMKVAFDEQLAAFKDELETTVTDLIEESSATLRSQIQAAQETVDPLAAIRKRLGQS